MNGTEDAAGQGLAPILVLTRPEAAARRFLGEVSAGMGSAPRALIAPLLRIEPVAAPPPGEVAGLVLTSENAVAHLPPGLAPGLRAWCVGDRTAAAARDAGLDAVSAAGDAEALIRLILARRPQGPLLHLRGEHARGDVAARLTAAGLPCDERVVYRQRSLPLPDAARDVLSGPAPVVLPVFSPGSAAILAGYGPFSAPLHVVAISPAAAARAAPLAPRGLVVASRPDAGAMIAATLEALGAFPHRPASA